MLAAASILLGVLLGFAAGGRIAPLRSTRLRAESLVLILFVGQAMVRGPLSPLVRSLSIPLWGACSLALCVVLARQLERPGLGVATVGVLANSAVVILNQGMPVIAPPYMAAASLRAISEANGFYRVADQRTILPALGDVLPIRDSIASLGDVLLAVGVCIFIVASMSEKAVVSKRESV